MTLCVIPIVRWGKAGVAHHDVAAVIAVASVTKRKVEREIRFGRPATR
jgi:hypothetical protein